jgi:hypothetical protein
VSPRRGEDDSAAAGMRLGGEFSARVQVGRFVLQIGSPAGMRADFAHGEPVESSTLGAALSQPEPPAALGAEQAIDDAESVTGKVERSLELFTALAQGNVDREFVLKETDALLAALERLDREGRHRDAIRLARALAALLALAMRWVALVNSLRVALGAARALGDAPAIAWARHELGTLFLGADDAAAANRELRESLRIRKEIGDRAGVEVTQQNLAALRKAFGRIPGDGTGPRPVVVAAIVAGALLLTAAGVGVALAVRGGEDGPPPADTTAPKVSLTETPEDRTEERSASFEFEADEEVQRFECRLDDGSFEECVSPQNVVGPLAVGEHVFAARAVDFAGNVGEAAVYEWTIEPGEGPAAVILDGPDELTNETEARFTIEAPGATRLECSLNDGDAEECRTVAVFEVDEGENTLVVRGFAGDTAGAPATYRWTVDTTPPEVKIDDVSFTSGLSVEVAFTPDESAVAVECALLERTEPPEGEPEPEPELLETQEDCTDPAAFTDLAPETLYRARVTVTDAAGNVGEPAEADFDTVADVA